VPGFGSLGKFFGKTVSDGAAFAAGVAVGPALAPAVEDVKAAAWAEHKSRRLDAARMAELVAEGKLSEAAGADEAHQTGVSDGRFAWLIDLAYSAPGLSDVLTLWRRGEIGIDQVNAALDKMKIQPELRD
jgi:hypothetical protein